MVAACEPNERKTLILRMSKNLPLAQSHVGQAPVQELAPFQRHPVNTREFYFNYWLYALSNACRCPQHWQVCRKRGKRSLLHVAAAFWANVPGEPEASSTSTEKGPCCRLGQSMNVHFCHGQILLNIAVLLAFGEWPKNRKYPASSRSFGEEA